LTLLKEFFHLIVRKRSLEKYILIKQRVSHVLLQQLFIPKDMCLRDKANLPGDLSDNLFQNMEIVMRD
jgi:hypothetical protein